MKVTAFKLFHYISKPLIGTGIGRIRPLYKAYKTAVKMLIPEQSKIIIVNGYKMHVRLEKGYDIDGISQRLIFDGEHEPLMTEVFKKIVKPKMMVLDIGAHIGYYTLLAASLVGSNGTVWAFEPEPRNFANLGENVKLNGYDNVFLVNKAVSKDSGMANLYISHMESGEHSLIPCRDNFGDTVTVPTVRLDDMFTTDTRVDVIKTDTEGNDIRVIDGARELINANSNIKIFTEFWPEGINAAGYSAQIYWDLLQFQGFKYIYLLDEFKKQAIEASFEDVMSYWHKHRFAANLLCSKVKVL
jgi:FkbM family methyltransferase